VARRHLTTAVTLLVLVSILVLGVVLGVRTLFAPLPGSDKATATPSPSCSPKTVKKGQRIRSTQVQVSVFNGGTRSGLADETMRLLARRGFTQGDVGNAPTDAKVSRVRVLTTEKNDMAAALVARQFGRTTRVIVTGTDLGPGIDVIVGNKFGKLAKAKRVLVAQSSSSVCVPLPSTSTGASTDAG
jgi:LytR cell envelope-related transcriptional attenuator